MEESSEEIPPKIQRAEKPIQSEAKRTFNLKNVFEQVEEEKEVTEDLSKKPKDDFDFEKLQNHWTEFLTLLQSENKIPAFNALQSGKLELKSNFKIRLDFSSASLVNEFDLQKERLMGFLREKLNNYSLEFETNIIHNHTENYIKSKAELFQEMAEENPLLLKMKEEFGLDLNSNE